MRPYCPICDGGNKTLLEEILRLEGPEVLAQCYSIPIEAIRAHMRES